MAMTKDEKLKIIEKFGVKSGDTGSAPVQIALLTSRINQLNEHFKLHVKDHSSRRGLLKLVGQRRHLLDYLKSKNEESYKSVIEKLKLRK